MANNYVVTLGHAVNDERGKGTGGKAGDQTGKEVLFEEWYISGGKKWDCVLRATDKKARKKIAECAIKMVRNNNWGYDMDQRYTGYDAVKNNGFDPDSVTKPVECDCSVMATICAEYAGIHGIPRDTYTGNLQARFTATKAFKTYTAKKYTTLPDNLEVGDYLLRAGHHVSQVVNKFYWLKSNIRRSTSNGRAKDVKAIQQRLNDLIGDLLAKPLVVDGEWGDKTDTAVKLFQQVNKLEDDGIIGKNTAEAMDFLFG